ncbi:MAG: MFS transporter [Proteobacteria bacterium]|nr:MFS transporter [Pseudomonadota bacterium]
MPSSRFVADREQVPVVTEGRMTRLHWRVFVLCGLVALLDGFDTQSLGPAANAIAAAIGVPVADFGPVFSASQVGFLVGAMIFSALGDRLGRKRMLMAGTLIFAVASLATAFVSSLPELVLVRFIGGVGLGGATPNFISLASEYSPPAQRARIVTLLWAAVPLGGMAGAFASALTLPLFGWRAIFFVGCLLPLFLLPVLRSRLPESAELGGGRGAIARRSFASTFLAEGRALPTLLLWLASWMTWTTLVVVAFWTPPLLQHLGWSASAAASVLGALNGGGVVGTIIVGGLLVRISAHRALCLTLFAAAAAIAGLGALTAQPGLVVAAAISVGFFASAAGGSMLAVSASLYPADVRATGIGWALGIGRVGAVLGPMAAGALLAANWPAQHIYYAIAVPPLLGGIFVALLAATKPFRAARGRAVQ